MNAGSRHRVLLLADACNPDWPSLPIVGYNMAMALANVADVTLATHVRNRENLEGRTGDLDIHYIDNEYIASPIHKLAIMLRGGNEANWSVAMAAGYPGALAFDWEVRRQFGAQLKKGEFDIVHRITPMSPTHPSPMAGWSSVPFVLGPLNGGLDWPAQFRAEMRREGEGLRRLRNLYKYLPYSRATFRNAAVILAAFEHTIKDLPANVHSKCIDFPEVGVDLDRFRHLPPTAVDQPLTFINVGRFVPLKLIDVVIRTFAASDLLRAQKLVLIGDGMERDNLENLVTSLGLESTVEFTGWLDQAAVAERVSAADVCFFPSIRELGGGVVVEAMACGCVPVVVDYGGPGGLVRGKECGAAVPIGTKEQLVERFVPVLERYVNNRSLLKEHASRAHQLAIDEHSWAAKAQQVAKIYDSLVCDQVLENGTQLSSESEFMSLRD